MRLQREELSKPQVRFQGLMEEERPQQRVGSSVAAHCLSASFTANVSNWTGDGGLVAGRGVFSHQDTHSGLGGFHISRAASANEAVLLAGAADAAATRAVAGVADAYVGSPRRAPSATGSWGYSDGGSLSFLQHNAGVSSGTAALPRSASTGRNDGSYGVPASSSMHPGIGSIKGGAGGVGGAGASGRSAVGRLNHSDLIARARAVERETADAIDRAKSSLTSERSDGLSFQGSSSSSAFGTGGTLGGSIGSGLGARFDTSRPLSDSSLDLESLANRRRAIGRQAEEWGMPPSGGSSATSGSIVAGGGYPSWGVGRSDAMAGYHVAIRGATPLVEAHTPTRYGASGIAGQHHRGERCAYSPRGEVVQPDLQWGATSGGLSREGSPMPPAMAYPPSPDDDFTRSAGASARRSPMRGGGGPSGSYAEVNRLERATSPSASSYRCGIANGALGAASAGSAVSGGFSAGLSDCGFVGFRGFGLSPRGSLGGERPTDAVGGGRLTNSTSAEKHGEPYRDSYRERAYGEASSFLPSSTLTTASSIGGGGAFSNSSTGHFGSLGSASHQQANGEWRPPETSSSSHISSLSQAAARSSTLFDVVSTEGAPRTSFRSISLSSNIGSSGVPHLSSSRAPLRDNSDEVRARADKVLKEVRSEVRGIRDGIGGVSGGPGGHGSSPPRSPRRREVCGSSPPGTPNRLSMSMRDFIRNSPAGNSVRRSPPGSPSVGHGSHQRSTSAMPELLSRSAYASTTALTPSSFYKSDGNYNGGLALSPMASRGGGSALTQVPLRGTNLLY